MFWVLSTIIPASCTFSTALVISAFKASVSSAETEAATGTTVNGHTTQGKERVSTVYTILICMLLLLSAGCCWMLLISPTKNTRPDVERAVWPVSWATALAARVTMSSVLTVTMLISLSEVAGPTHASDPSSVLPPATTSRFIPALPWWTVLTWDRRLSTRLNPLPHLSHRKGFSPERVGGHES